MKKLQAYKAVFFDAGDTLITIPAAHEIMQAYLASKNLPIGGSRMESVLTEAINHFYYNKKEYSFTAITPETDRSFWIGIYQYVMNRLEAERFWSFEQIHQCCHEMYDIFVSPEYYTLFSDVRDSLSRLRRMGLRLGVVSNFAPTLGAICEKHEIRHYFDPFIVSTEVGLEKPNPEIFAYALRVSGMRPEDVLYVGDHETNDIWAPGQVGIDALRIIRYDGIRGEGIRTLEALFD